MRPFSGHFSALLKMLGAITIFALCPSARAQDWSTIRTGTLTYPALNNLDLREGTLECWVKLGFDASADLPAKAYTGFVTFLHFEGESGSLHYGYQAQPGDKVPNWYCSVAPQTYFTGFFSEPAPWKKDEWHHFAMTWKGADMVLYLDGKEMGRGHQSRSLEKGMGALRGKSILFGNQWGVGTMVAIDDLRLSRVARRPEELGCHGPLKPDLYTSILDGFEETFTPDGKTTTHPAFLLSGEGALPTAPCQFVPGKYGTALSFYKP